MPETAPNYWEAWQQECDLHRRTQHECDTLRRERDRLRALIPLAIDAGYAKREAEEAQEYSDDRDRHPHCQDKADGERAGYEELLATLNRALEGEG